MKTSRMGLTGAEKKSRRMTVCRKLLSLVLLLLSAVPMLGGGVCALWVIPAAMCICMNEEPYFCMAVGVIAGIAIDIACGSALCANAIYLVCFCTGASLLFDKLLRKSFVHYLFLTIVCLLLRAAASYSVTVLLKGTEGREALWQEMLLPSLLKTIPAALLIYLFYLPIARLLTKRVHSMDAAAMQRA